MAPAHPCEHAHLHHRKLMVHQHCQATHWYDKKLRTKRVVVGIVRGLEMIEDEIQRCVRRDEEERFHHRVVHRNEGREEVKVASSEHHREKKLTLPRDPYSMRLG